MSGLRIRVTKRVLFFQSFLIWCFAGIMLVYKGTQGLLLYPEDMWWKLLLSFVLGFIFIRFLFVKIVRKHCKRIVEMSGKYHNPFLFLSFKSYIVMVVMISMGISIRKLEVIPIRYVSVLMVTMAISLLFGAFSFMKHVLKHRDVSR